MRQLTIGSASGSPKHLEAKSIPVSERPCTNSLGRLEPSRALFLLPRRLPEPVDEAVGLPSDRRVEDVLAVIVLRHPEHVGLRLEDEAGALEIGSDDCGVDPVELLDHLARVAA